MTRMFGHSMLKEWALDPDVLYLNHGTVGAPPRRVLQAQQRLRDEIEKQPSAFLLRELSPIRVGDQSAPRPRLRVAADQVGLAHDRHAQERVEGQRQEDHQQPERVLQAPGQRVDAHQLGGDGIGVFATHGKSATRNEPVSALDASPRPSVTLTRIVNVGLDYVVPRADGRLLVGSTIEDAGFAPATTPEAVARAAKYSRHRPSRISTRRNA